MLKLLEIAASQNGTQNFKRRLKIFVCFLNLGIREGQGYTARRLARDDFIVIVLTQEKSF